MLYYDGLYWKYLWRFDVISSSSWLYAWHEQITWNTHVVPYRNYTPHNCRQTETKLYHLRTIYKQPPYVWLAVPLYIYKYSPQPHITCTCVRYHITQHTGFIPSSLYPENIFSELTQVLIDAITHMISRTIFTHIDLSDIEIINENLSWFRGKKMESTRYTRQVASY